MHNTLVFCLSSVPSKDALPTVVFNAAMLNLRFRVFASLHKILIPADQWHAKHTFFFLHVFGAIQKFVAESNEYNTCGSASMVSKDQCAPVHIYVDNRSDSWCSCAWNPALRASALGSGACDSPRLAIVARAASIEILWRRRSKGGGVGWGVGWGVGAKGGWGLGGGGSVGQVGTMGG